MLPHPAHRRFLVAAALTGWLGLTGCSGSALNPDHPTPGTIRIGLLWPRSGPYQAIGDDLAAGWKLYLDIHGGRLGGKKITVTVADEGASKQTALASARKLLDSDHAQILAGTASADPTDVLQTLVTERKVPFVGTGGRPSTIKDLSHLWHTSWLSRETGAAIADHLRTAIPGPVWAIGPNYQGGWDQIGGFVDAYTSRGGKLANPGGTPVWTPWPGTTNFLPYLNQIAASGAKAVYCFYAGTTAVEFVKQYAQAGLAPRIPLYGAGFLTEGSVLPAQGAAADGVRTVLNYAPDLDNPANRAFVTSFAQRHTGAPNIYHVTGFDAAAVLDAALLATGPNPTSESINTAISRLGTIDSPRGTWRFGANHSPIQPWYLREVRPDGRGRANVVVQTLTTLGT